MVHEFGHMIDDGSLSGIGGDYLSLKPDFDQIKEVYREHIDSIDMLKERKVSILQTTIRMQPKYLPGLLKCMCQEC